MTKEQLIALGLSEEHATAVMTAYSESIKGFIPKSRFDEVNEAKNKLSEDIKARDKQLDELKKVDAEGLKAQIEKLQGENKAAKEKFDADMRSLQVNNAVEKALIEAQAKNSKAVRALLDLEKAELDENGNIKGLSDQIKKLSESEDSSFLFGVAQQQSNQQQQRQGFKPGETNKQPNALDSLKAQLVEADKKGDLALSISLERQIFEAQAQNS